MEQVKTALLFSKKGLSGLFLPAHLKEEKLLLFQKSGMLYSE